MDHNEVIGIVGGVGPYAGLDLNKKIFDQTIAKKDQDHLRVILFSYSPKIRDRTDFLMRITDENPAHAIFSVIKKLESVGAFVAGIPCNTAHSTEIFGMLKKKMNKDGTQVKVVHMIGEVVKFTRNYYPGVRKVGILATKGTIYSDVYTHHFNSEGIRVIYPDNIFQDTVHSAIYDSNFGIKAFSNPVKKIAYGKVRKAIGNLIEKGVDSIVLGCTELPLAIEVDEIHGKPILDSSLILARALIEKVAPQKLKPFRSSPDLA